jgi:hypothetical protein
MPSVDTCPSNRTQQPRDIDAADRQHGKDRAQQGPQRSLGFAGHILCQWIDTHTAALVRVRKCPGEVIEDMREIRLRLLHGVAILDPRHRLQPMVASAIHPPLVQMQRHVDGVARVEGKAEACRHHTDRRVSAAIQLNGLVHDVRIAAEVLLPYVIPENRDIVFSVLLFTRKERASKQGPDAEDLEEIIR